MIARDRFGARRVVYSAERWADSARALGCRLLDGAALGAMLDGAPLAGATAFAGVRALKPGHSLVREAGWRETIIEERQMRGDLAALMSAAVMRFLDGRRAAIALSGGLDSALLLALLRAVDVRLPAFILAPRIDGYSERTAAEANARAFGVETIVVEVAADDYRVALPEAIGAVEEPLYNLHPVSRFLLARAMRAAGVELMLTGDGADQVMRRDDSADYLPLVHALAHAAGVATATPFLDEDVIAHLLGEPPDPDKRSLRALAATLGVPASVVQRPKESRLAPPLPLGVEDAQIAALAAELGRTPRLSDEPSRVRWATGALLAEAVRGWA
jgi:asparagine synthetase B (glutamine-hydrolysing)